MTVENFVGTWNVVRTAGTPFGVGTVITVTGGQSPGISFDPPVSKEQLTLSYDPQLELLEVTDIPQLSSSLYLGVYLDPDDSSYAALYGVATAGVGLVTFAAVAEQAPGSTTRTGVTPAVTLPASNTVLASGGTQFGLVSKISFVAGTEGVTVSLVNALGDALVTPTLDWVGPATLQGLEAGESQEDRLVMQCSFVTIHDVQRCFGLATVGDPENSGVWAADEDDPVPA